MFDHGTQMNVARLVHTAPGAPRLVASDPEIAIVEAGVALEDLGREAGLTGANVWLVRIPGLSRALAPHARGADEEWLYVLEGRGVVEVGGDSLPVAPGDFLGLPAGSFAHHVRNPHGEDLVILRGGSCGDRCGAD
jgi:uncharacterized cupin superfamily protein